mmetsp:Transcript_76701/g.197556  ORF Transcript_76701/g.197556 Transcript_76701/m.197556 type:complete len:217 (+) Transcript_76701:93-743(+)
MRTPRAGRPPRLRRPRLRRPRRAALDGSHAERGRGLHLGAGLGAALRQGLPRRLRRAPLPRLAADAAADGGLVRHRGNPHLPYHRGWQPLRAHGVCGHRRRGAPHASCHWCLGVHPALLDSARGCALRLHVALLRRLPGGWGLPSRLRGHAGAQGGVAHGARVRGRGRCAAQRPLQRLLQRPRPCPANVRDAGLRLSDGAGARDAFVAGAAAGQSS